MVGKRRRDKPRSQQNKKQIFGDIDALINDCTTPLQLEEKLKESHLIKHFHLDPETAYEDFGGVISEAALMSAREGDISDAKAFANFARFMYPRFHALICAEVAEVVAASGDRATVLEFIDLARRQPIKEPWVELAIGNAFENLGDNAEARDCYISVWVSCNPWRPIEETDGVHLECAYDAAHMLRDLAISSGETDMH